MNMQQVLIHTARTVGEYLRENAFVHDLEWKSKDDPVTVLDKEAEKRIIALLEESAPGNYVGEESAARHNGLSRTYYIDPIDGTRSLVLKEFHSTISIGVEEEGEMTGGIVHDFMRDISYVGYKGMFTRLHREKPYVLRSHQPLSKVRVGVDKVPGLDTLLSAAGYKCTYPSGSIALTLAQVAAGSMDALVMGSTGKGHTWDIAAGYYLLRGQKFTLFDYFGTPFNYKEPNQGIVVVRPDYKQRFLQDLEKVLPVNERKAYIEI